ATAGTRAESNDDSLGTGSVSGGETAGASSDTDGAAIALEFHHAGERVSVSGAVPLFDLGAVLLPCPPAKVYESPFREVEVRDRDLVEIDGLDPERHYAVLAEVEGFARVWLFGLLPRALA